MSKKSYGTSQYEEVYVQKKLLDVKKKIFDDFKAVNVKEKLLYVQKKLFPFNDTASTRTQTQHKLPQIHNLYHIHPRRGAQLEGDNC